MDPCDYYCSSAQCSLFYLHNWTPLGITQLFMRGYRVALHLNFKCLMTWIQRYFNVDSPTCQTLGENVVLDIRK